MWRPLVASLILTIFRGFCALVLSNIIRNFLMKHVVTVISFSKSYIPTWQQRKYYINRAASVCFSLSKTFMVYRTFAILVGPSCTGSKAPLLYLHEILYCEVSLQASHHSFTIVNDREMPALIK